MPRNVRNFWIEAQVDGAKKDIGTGPRRADGGFDLTIYMRDQGGIMTALRVRGYTLKDGKLALSVVGPNGGMQDIETER